MYGTMEHPPGEQINREVIAGICSQGTLGFMYGEVGQMVSGTPENPSEWATLTFWLGAGLSRSPGIVFGARLGTGSILVRTSEFIVMHGMTKSRRAFQRLKDEIAQNGVTEPIKYVEHNGGKYVVDGHHRLAAARQLGITEIPAQKVSLPYLGLQDRGRLAVLSDLRKDTGHGYLAIRCSFDSPPETNSIVF